MTFTSRGIGLFALGGVPLLFVGLWGGFALISFAWGIAFCLLAWRDRHSIPQREAWRLERETSENLPIRRESKVLLTFENRASRALEVEIQETPPEIPNDLPQDPLGFSLSPQTRRCISYTLTPNHRGDFYFGDIYIRIVGVYGLVRKQWTVPAETAIKVYPNPYENAPPSLFGSRRQLQTTGARVLRIQGAGREFESLRDYQPDDELRRVDWKASARRGKLIARQYETERSQHVLFVFDVGRMMRAEIAGVAKLDYALNAALLLAEVAVQNEDRVGMAVFSDKVHAFLPPKRGEAQLKALLANLYNVQASFAESDYRAASLEIQTRWRKRSLVVWFTDMWELESARHHIEELARLQARHLVLAVSLLDTNLQDLATQEPNSAEAIHQKAVAVQVLEDRRRAIAQLKERGILVLDTPADQVSAALIQRYLEIKSRLLV